MTAKDYPITFGYGAIDGVYYGTNGSIGLYHRGNDRAMPMGTPVVVNGMQIGKSGVRYSGPHLHTGRFVNGKDTNPGTHGEEFTLTGAVVFDVGEDATNGKYVRLQDQSGVIWVYLHLSIIQVIKGQQIKEVSMNPTADDVTYMFINGFGRPARQDELDTYTTHDWRTLAHAIFESNEYLAKVYKKQLDAQAVELKPGKYIVK